MLNFYYTFAVRLPIVKTFKTIYIEISHDSEMDRGFFVQEGEGIK